MRPIPSPASHEAFELLKKANALLERADALEKGDKCPECGGKISKDGCMMKDGTMKTGCAGMKKYGTMQKGDMDEKDKYCMKNFGKKYSECTAEQKKQCDKNVDKVEKGEHHKAQSFDFNPGHVQFMSESGGQTFNAYYTTNQSLLDSEDVANKGASQSSVNIEALNRNQNPHDNPAPGHQTEG